MESLTPHQVVQAEIQTRALENRGTLPPRQLAQLAQTLTELLTGQRDDLEAQATVFARRGLALSAVIAAGMALQRAAVGTDGDAEDMQVAERLGAVITAMHEAEIELVRQEQEQLRAAVTRALTDQQAEAVRLTSLLHELSTPIVPIYTGVLVVPLIGVIDTDRAAEITDRLLDRIIGLQAESVIIDITGVPVVDTSVVHYLLQTAQAVRLLGASVILVGINPEVAQTISQLGRDLRELTTLSDLQAGVTFALRQRRLAIQPIQP